MLLQWRKVLCWHFTVIWRIQKERRYCYLCHWLQQSTPYTCAGKSQWALCVWVSVSPPHLHILYLSSSEPELSTDLKFPIIFSSIQFNLTTQHTSHVFHLSLQGFKIKIHPLACFILSTLTELVKWKLQIGDYLTENWWTIMSVVNVLRVQYLTKFTF